MKEPTPVIDIYPMFDHSWKHSGYVICFQGERLSSFRNVHDAMDQASIFAENFRDVLGLDHSLDVVCHWATGERAQW